MNIYFGQQQEDGVIRYITSYDFSNRSRNVPHTLQIFYPTPERVSALIELGNLIRLGATPYGKNQGYYTDMVHCIAEIRDEKKGKGPRLPKYADNEADFLKLEGFLFLYKENKWHFKYPNGLSTTLPEDLSIETNDTLLGLEFHYLDEQHGITSFQTKSLSCWNDVVVKSQQKQTPVFVFRNTKLITTINHPLNQ